MVDSTDEKHLLIDLKGGSFQAFERLYNMYSGKLYNFIMRLSSGNQYMAEEVVQATFIRIWEVHEKVDPASSFISFLCTIAKNLLMNMYQRQTVEYVYNEYLMKSSVDRDSQTEENIDIRISTLEACNPEDIFSTEVQQIVTATLALLPEQTRRVFEMSRFENKTNKEIAEIMGISESTVATQLSLAVKFMREQLMKHYDKVITLLLAFFVNEM